MGAMPEASLRFACGQCATCVRADASSARSSSETQTQMREESVVAERAEIEQLYNRSAADARFGLLD